jgi:hypothetical protein
MMHRFIRHAAVVAAVSTMLAPAVASAQIAAFTTLAGWTAAVSNVGIDTYNDLAGPPSSFLSPLNRTTTGTAYNYTANANGGFFAPGVGADRWLTTNSTTPQDIVFTGFSSSARAVGGFFFLTDLAGALATTPGLQLNVTLVAGANTFAGVINNPTTSFFVGFTSVAPLTSLTLSPVQPQGGPAVFATVNDLRIAAPAVVVPEPSTYALLATGLVAMSIAARRRRVS